MEQYKIGEVQMRFLEIIWQLEPVSLEAITEAARMEFGWKRTETEHMFETLRKKGIFVVEEGMVRAKISQSGFLKIEEEEKKGEALAKNSKRGMQSAFRHSFWAPIAFEEGNIGSRIKNIMKYRKTAVVLVVCAVLVCILAGVLFFTKIKEKEFSFQTLEREEIQKVEFNTREDFYYVFEREEADVLGRMLQKIAYQDSGTEDMDGIEGVKIRLTLTDGTEHVFTCSGHTLLMGDKGYYVEGDILDRIRVFCWEKWVDVEGENEQRRDFQDLYMETVRDVKAYDGSSLSYTLSEKEREEMLKALRELKPDYVEYTDESRKQDWFGGMQKRFLVEKKDGVQVEFYVQGQWLFVSEQMFSIAEDKGKALEEKLDGWLQAEREKTRRAAFAEFSSDKIKSVSAIDFWTGTTYALGEKEREELLALLRELTLVGEGSKDYERRDGMITEAFQIEDTDGNITTISANQDPFVVNGLGYAIENADAAERLWEMYETWGRKNESDLVESREVYGDFQLTIRSEQPEYQADRFTKNALFLLELEYIGAQEEIQIYHGEPLAMIDFETEDGKSILGTCVLDVGIYDILKKGEPYQVALYGEELATELKWAEELKVYLTEDEVPEYIERDAVENGSLKPGKYRAVAYVNFSVEGEDREESYNLKLPVEFDVR